MEDVGVLSWEGPLGSCSVKTLNPGFSPATSSFCFLLFMPFPPLLFPSLPFPSLPPRTLPSLLSPPLPSPSLAVLPYPGLSYPVLSYPILFPIPFSLAASPRRCVSLVKAGTWPCSHPYTQCLVQRRRLWNICSIHESPL